MSVLSPEQLRDLQRIARSERFALQRIRLRWFVAQGYIVLGPRPTGERRSGVRTAVLTLKAVAALDADPCELSATVAERAVKIYSSGAGYACAEKAK